MHMRYIIAYRLKRKNARRKEYSKFDATDEFIAIKQFESYIKDRQEKFEEPSKVWELLTGDWKHICYWCEECKRATDKNCYTGKIICHQYEELEGIGKKNEGLS